ncbi:hypothetical protein CFO_g1260 [Ceratocystis platani]|uniref:Uncharacterized protein n=1 Tax=Ceratocystis fimbriata f. sp. platani TaxID=88771 RepID=A0A0F8BUY6_CERFI|nr:hypothetical protein CFO_g1260 [Ceratocystis platani]
MSLSPLTACALDRAAYELELLSLNPKALSLSLDCRFSQTHPPFSPYASSFTESLSSSSDRDFSPATDRGIYSPSSSLSSRALHKDMPYNHGSSVFDCFDDSDDRPEVEHFEDVADDSATAVEIDIELEYDHDMPELYRCSKHNEAASWVHSPVQHVEYADETVYGADDNGYGSDHYNEYYASYDDDDYGSESDSDSTLEGDHFEFAQQHEVQAFLAQMQTHMEAKMAAQREKLEAKKERPLASDERARHQEPIGRSSTS